MNKKAIIKILLVIMVATVIGGGFFLLAKPVDVDQPVRVIDGVVLEVQGNEATMSYQDDSGREKTIRVLLDDPDKYRPGDQYSFEIRTSDARTGQRPVVTICMLAVIITVLGILFARLGHSREDKD